MASPAIRSAFTLSLTGIVAFSPLSASAAPLVRDGEPTAEACAALGFAPPRDDRRYRAGQMMGAPPPPAMAVAPGRAPIPPLPVPPVQPRTASPAAQESVSVTGSRIVPQPGSPVPQRDTERYPNATPNPVKRTAEEPVSTFSIDVDTASYANVRRFLNDGVRPPSDAVRVEELINYFDYGYAAPRRGEAPFAASISLAPSPWSAEREILHIGLQGYELAASAQPPLNLVFLIDTSGSMWSEDRLPLAKKAMNVLIDQLGPEDRVSMVAYAGSAGAVLAPTAGTHKLTMRCALGVLEAGGSTAGGQGLALAYDLAAQNFDPKAVNRVILMTDGDFNVGISDPERMKDLVTEKRRTGVYLSVYGFGRGNYNDVMMQSLAQNGNGTAAYIDTLAEARRLFRDDLPASLFPIADDVKIQVEFNPATVAEYRLIGYETRLLNREDFNNDQVDAGEVGSGASVTALYEITPVGARPSSDPLRYQPSPRGAGGGQELAFLKVRYKAPGGSESQLMTRPVTKADRAASLTRAPEATRWAIAVAAFGQKLRGDPWVADSFDWDEIETLAQGARGQDVDGDRAEFITLVRAAEDGRAASSGR
ncbi:VWA domain-containing protein [Phenylobacterium sp.]|uniref:vWA domain-containing protein n=1 Tax=Phenylobacterium sp. TaxID=1871053 RepID=UPI00272F9B50|nr:VWA domain-containing protein [Phenylobacterium sp.]MDP1616086.1 VWA domain-containing protein [Phenylobacterium sp.]MDP1987114.1 VWA domain-containing protein [Phenylobacterium sp.]